MTAIAEALAEPADQTRPPLVIPEGIREELIVILTYMLGPTSDPTEAIRALSAFAGRMNLSVSDDPDDDWAWDDGEGWLSCDLHNLDEARARAERGQVEDCLHHLERALPEGYGVIAERLAQHLRSRP
ncbi:MAG: hypothetical protein DI527_23415 [Chelatococcus sp.]|nr:MAG: hypothetical protein DI527_23415 [Chelatococcus sp.]